MFNSFSSCSPRYSKVYLKFEEFREVGRLFSKSFLVFGQESFTNPLLFNLTSNFYGHI